MVITSSEVSSKSEHSMSKYHSKVETELIWTGARPDPNNLPKETQAPLNKGDPEDVASLNQGKDIADKIKSNTYKINELKVPKFELSDKDRLKLTLLEHMLFSLTGKRFRLRDLFLNGFDSGNGLSGMRSGMGNSQVRGVGWGREYDSREVNYESEKMSYNAEGVVRTADGREINFSVNLNMSREFFEYTRVSVREGDAAKKIDPLIINFDGNLPMGLSDMKFDFDLTMDGNMEQISYLSKGNGFLAVDWNNDGTINDGGELFGAKTGDGFAELAQYDEDGNGWIDENDAIFDKLNVWVKDEDGEYLFSLRDLGIGAMYLGNIDTMFHFTNGSSEESNGNLSSSSVFLRENGTAGIVSHIDYWV